MINNILDTLPYADLTGSTLKRTPAEDMFAKAQDYVERLHQHLTDLIVSPEDQMTLQSVAFHTHCGLTDEEKGLPMLLLPKDSDFLHAYRGYTWHCANAQKQDPNKL